MLDLLEMKLTPRLLLLFTFPLFLNFSCDGFVAFKGNVLENNTQSKIISDSVYSSYDLSEPISNAMVNFYVLDDKNSILNNMLSNTFFTDSLGYFSTGTGVGLGKYKGLLVVSKNNFISDSLYFEFESSEEPLIFIVNLKRQK